MGRVRGSPSSKGRWILAAVGISAFLTGIVLFFVPGMDRDSDPERDPGPAARTDDPSLGPPASSDAAVAPILEPSRESELAATATVRESAESESEPRRVRLVSAESRKPLVDFGVWEKSGPSTRESPILRTDRSGEASLSRELVESLRTRANEEFETDGLWATVVPIRHAKLAHVGWPDENGILEISFWTLAEVRVSVTRDGARADLESVSIDAIPPMPPGIPEADRARLEVLRRVDVEAYIQRASELGSSVERIGFVRSGDELPDGEPVEMFLPFTGDVCITVVEKSLVTTTELATIAIGTIRELEMKLRDRPRISGRVLRSNGSPAPGVLVTVGMRTEFDSRTLQDGVPSPVPLFGVTIEKGANPAAPHLWTVISHAHAVSRADGTFDVAVEYTDDVAAWVFDPREGRGIVARDVGSRGDGVRGLDLVLTSPTSRRVRLVDENDAPWVGVDVEPRVVGGTRDFEIALPTVRTDEHGEFDASLFDRDEQYWLRVLGARSGSCRYRLADGRTARCKGPAPAAR
jgi:hypothetical protein